MQFKHYLSKLSKGIEITIIDNTFDWECYVYVGNEKTWDEYEEYPFTRWILKHVEIDTILHDRVKLKLYDLFKSILPQLKAYAKDCWKTHIYEEYKDASHDDWICEWLCEFEKMLNNGYPSVERNLMTYIKKGNE